MWDSGIKMGDSGTKCGIVASKCGIVASKCFLLPTFIVETTDNPIYQRIPTCMMESLINIKYRIIDRIIDKYQTLNIKA